MQHPDHDDFTSTARESERDPSSGPEPEGDPLLGFLVRWEDAQARGEDPTAEILCAGDARWLAELEARIAKRKRLRAILAMPAVMEAPGKTRRHRRPCPDSRAMRSWARSDGAGWGWSTGHSTSG